MIWAFTRGQHTTVVVNLSDAPHAVAGLQGAVSVATDRSLEGAAAEGTLELAPWSGAVIES